MSENDMAQIQIQQGELRFEVDTGLISELGERLVARPSIALAELIKNAYDADATRVTVLLENVTTPDGRILVTDNGSGMTFEAIRDRWMRLATTDKRENPTSPGFRRIRTGAKGIGRFAVGRLANRLSIHTIAQRVDGLKEEINVRFNWQQDFEPGQDLAQVPIHYERRSVPDSSVTGVTLLLEDLKDLWSTDEVASLRNDLVGLVDPFGFSTEEKLKKDTPITIAPGFSIELETPEFPEHTGKLNEYIMSGAWAILRGKIDSNGVAEYNIYIYDTEEDRTITLDDFENDFQQLIGVTFTIYYFLYGKEGRERFKNFDFGVRDVMTYARQHGGVRIYLDGFKAFGYGEQGTDWLGFDELRAQRVRQPVDLAPSLGAEAQIYDVSPLLRIPGNNQLFGAVQLSQSHHSKGKHGIEINIARDRLVENEAFIQLKKFIRNGVFWLTLQYARVEYADKANKNEAKQLTVHEIEPISPKLDAVLKPIEQAVDTSSALTASEKSEFVGQLAELREQTKQIDIATREIQQQRIDEISMLRVLASIGTLISFLNHQLRAIVDNLAQIITLFEIYTENVDTPIRPQFLRNIQDLRRWQGFVVQQVNLLVFLLGNQAKTEKRPYNIQRVINDVANALQGYQDDYGITFSNSVPDNLMSPPMFLAELNAIIINIFTNALKAVRGCERREIEVKSGIRSKNIYIQMFDTGKGLNIPREKAFLPFETTSLPDNILGEGTGLGLYIVKSLVAQYRGSVDFIDVSSPWQTCIEIELPKK